MILDKEGVITYVLFDTEHGWGTVFDVCKSYLTGYSMVRLRQIAITSVIIEKQYIDKDYRNTFSNFHSKKFITPQARCLRLHLFSDAIDFENPVKEKWNSVYRGYIILRPTLPNNIGRTLLSNKLFNVNGSFVCTCPERVFVNGVELDIEGFPFISQDTDATVCAQSALWMLLRFFSNRYKWYREVYPSDITNLIQAYPHGRSMPGAGLTMLQMTDILKKLGFSPLLYDKEEYKQDFLKFAYSYIESGFPILLGLPEHVVVANGHISNFTCEASTTDSYLDGFIVNDDNGLPYQKITHNENENPFKYSLDKIDSFIVPLPEKVFISVDQFEILIKKALKQIQHLNPTVPPLSRYFLTTGRSFKKHALERYAKVPEIRDLYIKLPMPHFIWVCELSDHKLYSESFHCRGEIIWDATRNLHDGHLGLVLHLPEVLIFDVGAANNKEPEYITRSKEMISYPIYRNNLKEV